MTEPGPDRPTDPVARSRFWESVHADRPVDGVSWWQAVPLLSLDLVERAGLPKEVGVLDVGAGASTLVDHLVARGYSDLTVVDLSARALRRVAERLGTAAADVALVEADVLDLRLGRRVGLWHDRAVFHFLTEPSERDAYRDALARHLAPDGFVALATFGPDGPTTCSGLPVVRYGPQDLAAELPGFELVAATGEDHETPWGGSQQFTAVLLRRRAA